jgi:uncharacterized protein YybS (DUF2232 family)
MDGSRSRATLGKVAAPLLSSALFLSIFFIPVLGGFFNPFSPLPIIYAFFRFGESSAVTAVFFSALMVVAATDAKIGVIFLLGPGLMALLMARLIARKTGISATVAVSAFASVTAITIFFAFIKEAPISVLITDLNNMAQAIIGELIKTYKKAGIQDAQLEYLVTNSALLAKWLVRILPGVCVSAALVVAFTNYTAYKFLQTRWNYLEKPDEIELTAWSPPEKMVFIFIAGLACILTPNESSRIVGINLLIITGLIYSIAGLYILQFWFDKINFPKFLRLFVYILVLLQPILAAVVAGAGLFDLWFDFRKIRPKKA